MDEYNWALIYAAILSSYKYALIGDLQDFSMLVVNFIGKKFEKKTLISGGGLLTWKKLFGIFRIYLESSGVNWDIVGHNNSHDDFQSLGSLDRVYFEEFSIWIFGPSERKLQWTPYSWVTFDHFLTKTALKDGI